jgi:adenine-specific DNA-methyltransferase
MKPNQKLELTWIGKGEEPKLEPRILIEQPEYSYGDPGSGNMLILGDNLLALKALEQDYAGKVKCIYIDPPYNTGNAFEHYDDGIEHSLWLNLMAPRLKILRDLLSNDGSIWISIDDNEAHYLKVIMDEIFGRKNFVANVIWEKRTSRENRRVFSFKGFGKY